MTISVPDTATVVTDSAEELAADNRRLRAAIAMMAYRMDTRAADAASVGAVVTAKLYRTCADIVSEELARAAFEDGEVGSRVGGQEAHKSGGSPNIVPPTQKAACDELSGLVEELAGPAVFLKPELQAQVDRAVFLIGALEMAHELGGRWSVKKQGGD